MKKFTNFLICFLVITLILFWLYLKIAKTIPIIELTPEIILQYKPYFQIIQYLNGFILLFILLIVALTWYLRNSKITPESVFFKLTKIFKETLDYLNIFYRAYVILFNATSGDYTIYLIKLAKYCLSLKIITYDIIIFCFISLPRILILLSLVIEIYFGQLYYYFYSLLLLLIPLLFRLILFMLKDVGPRVLPELHEIVQQNITEITYKAADGVEKKGLAINYSLKPEHSDLNLDGIMEYFYYPAFHIEGHIVKNINPRVNIISKITVIGYYIITIIAFTYILQI